MREPKNYGGVEVTDAEALKVIDELQIEAQPKTVERVTKIISDGRNNLLTSQEIAEQVCSYIHGGEQYASE